MSSITIVKDVKAKGVDSKELLKTRLNRVSQKDSPVMHMTIVCGFPIMNPP